MAALGQNDFPPLPISQQPPLSADAASSSATATSTNSIAAAASTNSDVASANSAAQVSLSTTLTTVSAAASRSSAVPQINTPPPIKYSPLLIPEVPSIELLLFRARVTSTDEAVTAAFNMVTTNAPLAEITDTISMLDALSSEIQHPPPSADNSDAIRISQVLMRLLKCRTKLLAQQQAAIAKQRASEAAASATAVSTAAAAAVAATAVSSQSAPAPAFSAATDPNTVIISKDEMEYFRRLRVRDDMIKEAEKIIDLARGNYGSARHLQNLKADFESAEKQLAYKREKLQIAEKEHLAAKSVHLKTVADFTAKFPLSYETFIENNPRFSPSYARAATITPPAAPSAIASSQQSPQLPPSSAASVQPPQQSAPAVNKPALPRPLSGAAVDEIAAIGSRAAASGSALLPPPKPNVPQKLIDLPAHPTRQECRLCRELGHWTHLCAKYSNIWDRKQIFANANICPKCGRKHTGQICPTPLSHFCKWFHCCAKDDHLSALCPNVPADITPQLRAEWKKQLYELKEKFPSQQK